MRVKLTHHVADDGRRLPVLDVAPQAKLIEHGVQDSPLHRLQPVAYIRKRARRDDTQRVVEIAALRLDDERRVLDAVHGELDLRSPLLLPTTRHPKTCSHVAASEKAGQLKRLQNFERD